MATPEKQRAAEIMGGEDIQDPEALRRASIASATSTGSREKIGPATPLKDVEDVEAFTGYDDHATETPAMPGEEGFGFDQLITEQPTQKIKKPKKKAKLVVDTTEKISSEYLNVHLTH